MAINPSIQVSNLSVVENSQPILDRPGAGLPSKELFFAKLAFRFSRALNTQERMLGRFEDESNQILDIFESITPSKRRTQVLISRLVGMEDSSRNWSPYMVLQHLVIVNRAILSVLERLQRNEAISDKADTARVKPLPTAGVEVVEGFNEIKRKYCEYLRDHTLRKGGPTYAHPWFGELSAFGWHCLASVHLGIHRKQLKAIAQQLSL